MADTKPIAATLELVYVPDTYTDTERQEGASWPLGSGFYDLQVLANDARITLHRFKAGAVDKQFALAKERKESEQQQAPPAEQQQAPLVEQPQQTEAGTQTETSWQQPPPSEQQQPPPQG